MNGLLRSITARPTLLWSFVGGFAVGGMLPQLFLVERLLAGWCIATTVFVVAVSYKLGRLPPEKLSLKAGKFDEGAISVLGLGMLAALTSFAGVAFELYALHVHTGMNSVSLTLMVVTIVSSWFFVHTVFAIHYAHAYYSSKASKGLVSLDFGGDKEPPDYWDFVYFAVAIGASSATSDTNLHSRLMRRVVAAHAIFSFFFNATVLALAINIAAGLLGGN